MPKFMNIECRKYDLQLFAEGDDDAGDDSGDGDDQDDDDDSDEGGDDEPKYTKADLEKAVARTIAKERRKAERAAAKGDGKGVKPKPDGKTDDTGTESEDAKARKAAESKSTKLEVKVACFEADVAKEAVDDVAALAHAYMVADEDLDLEDSIEKVVKKYPQFKKETTDPYEEDDETKGKSWGQRQKGKSSKKADGIEYAFMKKNPGLKID
ncbi:MAG: hypothetical protein RR746_08455 [Lachnospiraceae bacterium]